jgi:hypothetical protein
MSRCYALTNQGTPCRNYGSILENSDNKILYSPTCSKHKSYDFKKDLLTRAQALEWDSIEYNYYKRVLEDGVLEITKEDIDSLPKANYTHFLLLCAKYVNGFEFNWNKGRSLAALANLWWQSRSVGPIYVSKGDIIKLAQTCWNDITTLCYCLASFPGEKYLQPTKDEWIRFLDYYFDELKSICIPTFVSKEFAENTSKLCQSFHNTFMKGFLDSGEFTKYIEQKKKSFYKYLKDKMDSVKEELVEVTWHPDRFMNWCMDWEEKDWILSQ